jgi:RNA ligase (TIGR02306 family)
MSEFHVVVTEITKVEKHPNADNLSISNVLGAYPVIFKTGDFLPGDKAVYIPVDAMVPTDNPVFGYVKNTWINNHPGQPVPERIRVRAKKLRGIFSLGFLIPCDPGMELGQNVQDLLNITKYEEIDFVLQGDNEKDPGRLPKYTDIEGLRKYMNFLEIGTEVVLTEKLHGTNFRATYHNDRLWVGSHHCIKKEMESSLYWKAAHKYNLSEKLKLYPNLVIYGEVFGQVQDLKYGVSTYDLRGFDIYDHSLGRYLDYDAKVDIFSELGIDIVPTLYRGPWIPDICLPLAEGKTTINNANHVREGFVVTPVKESWDPLVGRVIFKYIGEGYYLRKQKD